LLQREEIAIKHHSASISKLTRHLQSIDSNYLSKINFPWLDKLMKHVLKIAEPSAHVYKQSSAHRFNIDKSKILTVLSSNLWHDWPRHRRLIERLEVFARLVEEESADLILLQEVARTHRVNADEWLAERLGMNCLYARVNGSQEIGFEEGLAILSRYPLNGSFVRQLDSPFPFIHRMALGADVSAPGGHIVAFSVHLGLSKNNNNLQQDQLRQWIADLPTDLPIVIGGDFNAHETSKQILVTRSTWLDTFRYTHPRGDASTHELHWPWGGAFHQRRLDYIFLQAGKIPWKILESGHLRTRGLIHSDHRTVFTRMTPA
jgi:endonuclease/exonuclease/phosphatase family metal-dependent hydrolase